MGRWWFILLAGGFLTYVFFASDTLETHTSKRTNEVSVEFSSTSYSLRWDRFFDYLKRLPAELEYKVRNLL